MKDTLVSFKTAKLAKKKKVALNFTYNNVNYFFWNNNEYAPNEHLLPYREDKKINGIWSYKKFLTWDDFALNFIDTTCYYERPTQSLLQKYLREKHNIVVLIEHGMLEDNSFGYFCRIYPDVINTSEQFKIFDYSKSYEQILEKGLYEALKLIKKGRKIQDQE